ncbi:N-acetylmuramoyl-L-alanine amidase [Streptomyces sp. NPDC088732]|uniref:N-acetylmuramoyl-L-alanine amidase n=1 Tax=Streptomyces sp. NPDC088732 TaxID=3365879 RepID=UPI003802A44B
MPQAGGFLMPWEGTVATPLTPDQLVDVLRAEGVHVAEYPGWRTRQRDGATGKTFGPVHLLLNHHTGGRDSLKLVAETGRPDLPAPLAHTHLAKTGLATLCSAGRANHAGLMGAAAYNSFASEATAHPAPTAASGTVDGNDCAYGIETENLGDGKDVYPRAQYDALVRWNAALCRHYGWSAQSCAGHLETSVEGKPDPKGPVEGYGSRGRFNLTMSQLRADVAERLTHPANWSPEEDTDMPLTDAEISKVAQATAQAVWAKKLTNPHRPNGDGTPGQTTASALQTSEDGHSDAVMAQLKALRAEVAGLTATVTTLAGQLGEDVDTDEVIAAVEKAIAAAVVKVDVSITGSDAHS